MRRHAPRREAGMNQGTLAYEQLIERFVAWARTRPDIHVAIVVGSRARADRPADEWSDLDIVMFVTDPEPYLTSTDWLNNMGDFRITFVEPTVTPEQLKVYPQLDDELRVPNLIVYALSKLRQ